MNETMRKKLSPQLQDMIEQRTLPEPVPVIIQTIDGLKEADKDLLNMVGGELIDDLWIIKGFSATVPGKALETVVLSDRVKQVDLDGDVSGI